MDDGGRVTIRSPDVHTTSVDLARASNVRPWAEALTAARLPARSFALTVAAAIVAGVPILLLVGANPIDAYRALAVGSMGSERAVGETLVAMTPLVIAGLAITVAFRARVFNLGVEGQLILGGLSAGAIGTQLDLPTGLHQASAIGAGAVVGAVWAGVAGLLRAYRGVHEVITTIMLNYVAFGVSTYLVGPSGPLRGETQPRATDRIDASARLPNIWDGTRVHLGLVVALLLAGACWYLIFHSSLGYRFRIVGANETAARFHGVSPQTVCLQSMMLSGALAGTAGAVEVIGPHGRYFDAFSPGYGFDSIAVALLGFLHPVGVIASAWFLATLRAGSGRLQADVGVSRDVVTILSGVVIAFVAARAYIEERIVRRRHVEGTS
jgi:general nucleoside transport system permease protein